MLYPARVLKGEVWRIFTFAFIPEDTSIIFILFSLYINYFLGTSLERAWGAFKFNVYYFAGFIGIIIGAFATGIPMDNYYLNLSLFFAFAKMFPDFELMIFFVLPVKVKYLAWISWGFFLLSFIGGTMGTKISILLAVANYFLFFGKSIVSHRKSTAQATVRRRAYRVEHAPEKGHRHECTVCHRTDETNHELEFRICSKCEGKHEYCMDHLFGHEHIKNQAEK